MVEGLVAPGEGGRRGRGQPLRTPIAFPVSSAPPGRGPSREVASPVVPQPTRDTEIWEGNQDTPPYGPAPEEGERIQREPGTAALFPRSVLVAGGNRTVCPPALALWGACSQDRGGEGGRWVVGDSGGEDAVVEGLVAPGEGGEGEVVEGALAGGQPEPTPPFRVAEEGIEGPGEGWRIPGRHQ